MPTPPPPPTHRHIHSCPEVVKQLVEDGFAYGSSTAAISHPYF